MIEMVGNRYGRLLVIEELERYRNAAGKTERVFLCRCDCGNKKIIKMHTLRSGNAISCGCYRKEFISSAKSTHRMSGTKIYRVWRSMRRRCNASTDKAFVNYGARGITVCAEWESDFNEFYKWAISNGYNEGLTIERIDNNKGYSPDNCKWIPRREQNKNRRMNHYLAYGDRKKTLQEWANEIGVNRCTLRDYCKRYGDKQAVAKAIEMKRMVDTK